MFKDLIAKATDLEWFQFENKVRQIVQDLLEPMQIRTNFVLEKADNINSDINVLYRYADELKFTITKLQNQNENYDLIKNQVYNFENQTKQKIQGL